MSKDNGCDEPAEVIVTWAEKMLDVCRYHATAFHKLAAVIGSSSDTRPYIGVPKTCAQPDKWSAEDKASIDKQLAESES